MKLLGVSGSLRQSSYNTLLLQASGLLLPAGVELTLARLHDIPLYNGDLDGAVKPPPVANLLAAIEQADGLLFACPEYNYSLTGVLKNALDWASRPAFQSVLAGKPVGIVSGARSYVGGGRAQAHLRDVLAATLSPVVPVPAFLVPMVQEKFADTGELADGGVEHGLRRYLESLVDWVRRLRAGL